MKYLLILCDDSTGHPPCSLEGDNFADLVESLSLSPGLVISIRCSSLLLSRTPNISKTGLKGTLVYRYVNGVVIIVLIML